MDSLIEWMIEHLTFKVGSLAFPYMEDLFTAAILFVTRGDRLWGWPDSKLLKMEKSKPGLGQETTLRPINGQFKKRLMVKHVIIHHVILSHVIIHQANFMD